MKIAIMQNYFLPFLGYYQLFSNVDKFVFLNDCNYIKKGWINRNRILNKNTDLLFTLPLEAASQNKKINETKISKEYDKWKQKFLISLDHCYKKAPHYSSTSYLIDCLLKEEHSYIDTLAKSSIVKVLKAVGLPLPLITESSNYENSHLKGEERIIDICLKEKATHYINPIGGKDLYNPENFKKHNIELSFLKSNLPKYTQWDDTWMAALSMIDVLMFNNDERIKIMLKDFELEK